jgi:predicted MFS family arabinose efflux permease
MKKHEWIVLLLLAAVNFTHILDFMIMMPLGNYLMPYFNISTKQFSFLVSAYTFSAAVSGFGAAFFVDHFDRKKVLLFGYSGFLVGTLACGIAPSFALLLIARIVAGLFGGLIGAQVLSIVSDIFPYNQRGKAMGTVMSAFAIASTFGVPFSLYLANIISWNAPFILVAVLGLVLLPLLMRFIPKMDGHLLNRTAKESPFEALNVITKERKLMLALLFSGLIMMGHFLIIPFINPYMEFNNGYSKQETPLIYLAGGIAAFISANVLGRLSDRLGKYKIFNICIFLSLPLVIIITNLPAVPIFLLLTLFAIWFAFATGRGVTAQAMLSNVVATRHKGSFMSFNSSIQQFGSGLASLMAGYIVDKDADGKILHYPLLGYGSVVILVVCLLLGRYLFKGSDVVAQKVVVD